MKDTGQDFALPVVGFKDLNGNQQADAATGEGALQ